MDRGATLVSRCQVNGFRLYKMFKLPVAAPSGHKETKIDAELYAVTPDCLWWCDERMGSAAQFDRVNVVAHMFSNSAPKDPHIPKMITGMQAAWMHFYIKPIPDHAVCMGSIYDFENYECGIYETMIPGTL